MWIKVSCWPFFLFQIEDKVFLCIVSENSPIYLPIKRPLIMSHLGCNTIWWLRMYTTASGGCAYSCVSSLGCVFSQVGPLGGIVVSWRVEICWLLGVNPSFATSHKLTGKPWPLTVASKNLLETSTPLKPFPIKMVEGNPTRGQGTCLLNFGYGNQQDGWLKGFWLGLGDGGWIKLGWLGGVGRVWDGPGLRVLTPKWSVSFEYVSSYLPLVTSFGN